MCFANQFMLYAAVQLVHNLTTFQNADNVPVRGTSGHPWRCGDQSIDDEIPGNEPPRMYIVSGEYGAIVFLHILYFEVYIYTWMKLYLFRDIHNLIRVTACLELYLRSTTIRENLLGGVTEISD